MNEEDLPSCGSASATAACWWRKTPTRKSKSTSRALPLRMQLMRNIAQRKSTILRTCEVIVRRQQDFLDQGVEPCGR